MAKEIKSQSQCDAYASLPEGDKVTKSQVNFFLYALCAMLYALSVCSCAKPLYREKYVIAGTYLEVTSPRSEAARIVYEEMKRLDKIFNFYDPNSEISKINKTYNSPCKVSGEMLEILRLAASVNRVTKGAFDISYGALYDFWKQLIKKGGPKDFPSPEHVGELKEIGGMHNIEIDFKESTVLIKQKGLKIDLGGIAAGYMVDKAVIKLKENGIASALINLGGDIYCLGTKRDHPWRIGIKGPEQMQDIIENEFLVDEAITTSGNYEQFFTLQGKRYSHLVNPKTGYPVDNNVISVSVITKNCTSADSLATAFFVMGTDGIKDFLARIPSTMRIFVVVDDEKGKRVLAFR